MIDVLFKFRGRLTRWKYFLTVVALSLGPVVVLAPLLYGIAALSGGHPPSKVLLIGLSLLVAIPEVWISLSVQTARIRDIGLPPIPVFAAAIVINLLYFFAAKVIPVPSIASAISSICAIAGFGWGLALLFLPSHFFENSGPDSADPVTQLKPALARPAPHIRQMDANRPMFGRRGINSQ